MPLVERREACVSLSLLAKAVSRAPRLASAELFCAPFGAPLPHVAGAKKTGASGAGIKIRGAELCAHRAANFLYLPLQGRVKKSGASFDSVFRPSLGKFGPWSANGRVVQPAVAKIPPGMGLKNLRIRPLQARRWWRKIAPR